MKHNIRDDVTGQFLPIEDSSEYVGRIYGKLEILKVVRLPTPRGVLNRYAICYCSCGNACKINLCSITRPEHPTRSCGCIKKAQEPVNFANSSWNKKGVKHGR